MKKMPQFEVYREAEHVLVKMVYEKFGLDGAEPEDVKIVDKRIFATEIKSGLLKDTKNWNIPYEAYSEIIRPVGPLMAKNLFIREFENLFGIK
jgi:hypothetical protein